MFYSVISHFLSETALIEDLIRLLDKYEGTRSNDAIWSKFTIQITHLFAAYNLSQRNYSKTKIMSLYSWDRLVIIMNKILLKQ